MTNAKIYPDEIKLYCDDFGLMAIIKYKKIEKIKEYKTYIQITYNTEDNYKTLSALFVNGYEYCNY